MRLAADSRDVDTCHAGPAFVALNRVLRMRVFDRHPTAWVALGITVGEVSG